MGSLGTPICISIFMARSSRGNRHSGHAVCEQKRGGTAAKGAWVVRHGYAVPPPRRLGCWSMRGVGQSDGVSVKAYAGTTGVILAFDVDGRASAQGCSASRSSARGGNRPHKWLAGALSFPGVEREPGEFPSSDTAPIQKFRWSDYTVFPDTTYTYTVHPVYGDAGEAARSSRARRSRVMTSSITRGDHRVVFNRAAAASQAFSRQFPEVEVELDAPRARRSASRSCRRRRWRGSAAARSSRSRASARARWTRRGRWTSRSTSTSCRRSATRSTPRATAAPTCGSSTTRSHDDHQTELNEEHVADWPREPEARPRDEPHLPRQVHGAQPRRQRAAHARRRCCAARRTSPTTASTARRTSSTPPNRPELAQPLPRAVRGAVRRRDAGRDEEVDQRQQPAVVRRRPIVAGFSPRSGEVDLDLFAAEIRGAGARRAVLHGVRPQRAHPRGAEGQAARRDPALRAAELARRDHRHPPRPHRRLRRDRDAQRGARGLPQGVARRGSGATSSSTPSSSSSTSRPTRRRSSAARTTCRRARRAATTRTS